MKIKILSYIRPATKKQYSIFVQNLTKKENIIYCSEHFSVDQTGLPQLYYSFLQKKNTLKNMNSNSLKISNENLKRRLNAERRFKFYGVIAITLALIFVLILFTNIISKGYSAFYRTLIEIKIEFNDKVQPEMFKQMSDTEINKLDLYSFSKKNIYSNFPDIEKKSDKKKIIKLFSIEFEEEIKTYINKNKN